MIQDEEEDGDEDFVLKKRMRMSLLNVTVAFGSVNNAI